MITPVYIGFGLVVKRPITSPCHGEDRRFESGRARHVDKYHICGILIYLENIK